MYDPSLPVYVADTHALFWYRRDPDRLSAAADAVFRLASAGGAYILIPAIVIAEFFYLSLKLGNPTTPSVLLADIKRSREFRFSELGQAQLTKMEEVDGVTEMHDRLIAAEALVWQAPIITREEVLRRSGVAEIIW